MSLKEKVEKICCSRYDKCNVPEKEYRSTMRQLMCRLIDVDEQFPYEYDGYDDIKETYLPDFLRGEEDCDYSFTVEPPRNNVFKLIITDWLSDRRNDEIIKIPSFILEDNWKNNSASRQIHKRIKEIDSEITRLENILQTGESQISELKNEKIKLENELKEYE